MEGNSSGDVTYTMSTYVNIIVPPLSLLFLLFMGLLVLNLKTQRGWWKYHVMGKAGPDRSQHFTSPPEDLPFYTLRDSLLMDRFSRHQNNPWGLIKLSLPAIFSLAVCPLTLFLYRPMVSFFWEDGSRPDVNEAISCFLTPAGLVYAIAFGFAFQEAQAKQGKAEMMLVCLDTYFQQIRLLTNTSNMRDTTRRDVIKFLRDELFMITKFILRCCFESDADGAMLVFLTHTEKQRLMKDREKRYKDIVETVNKENATLREKLLDELLKLHTRTSHKHMIVPPTLSLLSWVFLETLGFFAFFGILMVKAMSSRLELTICMLTVFSVSMFCYVLGDLDQPHHGVFRVDLSIFSNSLDKLGEDWSRVPDPVQPANAASGGGRAGKMNGRRDAVSDLTPTD